MSETRRAISMLCAVCMAIYALSTPLLQIKAYAGELQGEPDIYSEAVTVPDAYGIMPDSGGVPELSEEEPALPAAQPEEAALPAAQHGGDAAASPAGEEAVSGLVGDEDAFADMDVLPDDGLEPDDIPAEEVIPEEKETPEEDETEAEPGLRLEAAEEQASLLITEGGDTVTPVTGIDFGTIDLSKGPYTVTKELWYKPVSMAGAPTAGGYAYMTVEHCYFAWADEDNGTSCDIFGNPLTWGNGSGFGGNSRQEDRVILNATDLTAGTYDAVYHVHVVPQCVDSSGILENDPLTGDILIPVTVTLTGINPNLPQRVQNLRAEPGNGSIALTWDAIDSFGLKDEVYNIYRRDGGEPGTDPDGYDPEQYQWIGSVEKTEGRTAYVDDTVSNGQAYSYFVMGGEPGHGYPCRAVCAVPSDQAPVRLAAPSFSAGAEEGGVLLEWTLDPDELYPGFPEGYADGEGVIDHFNIYRNSILIARVGQNACRKWANEDKYSWSLRVPCEDLSGSNQQAGYTWWITAAAVLEKGGLEGYESEHVSASPLPAKPLINYYSATWNRNTKTVTLHADTEYSVPRLWVWRDGIKVGSSSDWTYNGIDFEDAEVAAGRVYTYRIAFENGNGVQGEPVEFTVKTSGEYWMIDSPNLWQGINWRIRDGQTVEIDGLDVEEGITYRIYRNDVLSAVYGEGGTASDVVAYRDTPEQAGTYVYRVEKVTGGVSASSMEIVFVKEAGSPALPEKPEPPELTARIVGREGDRKVMLSWTAASGGGEAEGFYIYRTDAGVPNTAAYNDSDGQEEFRLQNGNASEPAQGRYFRRFAPGNSFTDEKIIWSVPDAYPHEYYVCAYNEYGISEPSNVITYPYMDENGDGSPDEPKNADSEAPAAPVITQLAMHYDEETYGIAPAYYCGYLDAAWEPGTGGGEADSYTVTFFREGERDYEVTRYPGISGEDGQLSISDRCEFPRSYGNWSVRVTASNSAGSASVSEDYYIGGVPSLSARPGKAPEGGQGACALLEWTAPYQDNSPVHRYEIRRRQPYGQWEIIPVDPAEVAYNEGSGTYSYTDTGLSDGETYQYCVAAITDSPLPERRSIIRETVVYEGYDVPARPVLLAPVLYGSKSMPDILLSWEDLSSCRPTAYYLELKKGADADWEDLVVLNGTRRALLECRTGQEFIADRMYRFENDRWRFFFGNADTVSLRLQAVNLLGESEWSEPVTIAPAQMTAAWDPADQKAYYIEPDAEAGDGEITLTWNSVPAGPGAEYADAVCYRIFRYEVEVTHGGSGADWETTYYDYNPVPDLLTSIPAGEDSYTYTDRGLENGQVYAYHVAAYSAAGLCWNDGITDIKRMDGVVMVTPSGKTADEKAADQVSAVIRGLPSEDAFDPKDEEQTAKVREAEGLLNSLTDAQRALVGEREKEKLQTLLRKIRMAENEELAQEWEQQITEAQDLIDALPGTADVTAAVLDDEAQLQALRTQIEAARGALEVLPEAVLDWVDTTKLTDLEAHLEALQQGGPGGQDTLQVLGTSQYIRRISEGAFALDAAGTQDGAQLTYVSTDPQTATVDESGLVTPLAPGTVQVLVKAACGGFPDAQMTVIVNVTGLAKGGSLVCGAGTTLALYQVSGPDTVTYVKCRAGAGSKTLAVPDSVTINSASYRVAAVGDGAFAGYKKVKKLTIGANAESIGKKAFSKCKKLKTLTLKTARLTPAGCRKSLAGSSVKTVKAPKAAKKAYKKIFVKKVCGRKVKVK